MCVCLYIYIGAQDTFKHVFCSFPGQGCARGRRGRALQHDWLILCPLQPNPLVA